MLKSLIKQYLLPVLIMIILGVVILLNHKEHLFSSAEKEIVFETEEERIDNLQEETKENERIVVDIKGAVKDPGVYEVDEEARVYDIVELAGGFTKDADENQINLAEKAYDEMVIYVPNKREIDGIETVTHQSNKIRINYATAEEIEQLQGIGPSKAKAIIQYREEYGPFRSVEDLLNVSGIGEKTLENIKDDIQIP